MILVVQIRCRCLHWEQHGVSRGQDLAQFEEFFYGPTDFRAQLRVRQIMIEALGL